MSPSNIALCVGVAVLAITGGLAVGVAAGSIDLGGSTAGRYTTAGSSDGAFFLVDRQTGDVRRCYPRGCKPVPVLPAEAPKATQDDVPLEQNMFRDLLPAGKAQK